MAAVMLVVYVLKLKQRCRLISFLQVQMHYSSEPFVMDRGDSRISRGGCSLKAGACAVSTIDQPRQICCFMN